MMKRILLVLTIIFSAVFLFGCNENQEDEMVTISYNTDGGNLIQSVEVKKVR